jgi:Helicase associated domain
MASSGHTVIYNTVFVCYTAFFFASFAHGLSAGGNGRNLEHSPAAPPIIAHELSNTAEVPNFNTSPVVDAIREADFARRILKQRSSRRRATRLLLDDAKPTLRMPQWRPPATQNPKATPYQATAKLSKSRITKSSAYPIDLPYESAIQALRVYHDQHSHLVMPRNFLIEGDNHSQYPKEWQGLDLAGAVYDMKWWIRHVKEQPERVAELNKLGFVWERLQPEWNLILEALLTYRTLNDDLLVPTRFVVPFGDKEWSRSTWGISLGKVVHRIRSRGDFIRGPTSVKRRRQLEALGFVWDVSEHLFKIFCKALKIYSKVEAVSGVTSKRLGALKIPAHYVVPESDEWPVELWGYPLGAKCTAVRQKELYVKGHPERLKELADIGYHGGGNDSLKWLEVVHAAAIYSQMHGRNLDVPQHFVVPAPPRISYSNSTIQHVCVVGSDDAWPWPGEFHVFVALCPISV